MKIKIYCMECKERHLDHYECDKCGSYLGGIFYPAISQIPGGKWISWKYCPFCAEPLFKESDEV